MSGQSDNSATGLDFVEAVANCVHDLKNSAGVLMNTADSMREVIPDPGLQHQLSSMQIEAQRINHDLMNLLGLYKLDRTKQVICPTIVDCEDLLTEVCAYNESLLNARGIELSIAIDEAIEGYFDREMIIGIINSAINNAQRYAEHVVRIGCTIEDGYTVFMIDDDGAGYPNEVLARLDADTGASDYRSGSTGLGLFFAERIAALHSHRGRCGRVSLSNDGIEGGARFCLWLP